MTTHDTCPKCGKIVAITWPKPLTHIEREALAAQMCGCSRAQGTTYGVCNHCGQLVQVPAVMILPDKDVNEAATRNCTCPASAQYRKMQYQIEEAKERVTEMYEEPSEDSGFRPVDKREVLDMIYRAIELIGCRQLRSVTRERKIVQKYDVDE